MRATINLYNEDYLRTDELILIKWIMKTGKITLTKEIKLNGDIRYYIYYMSGVCLGNSSNHKEALQIYNRCCKNIDLYGKTRIDVLKTHKINKKRYRSNRTCKSTWNSCYKVKNPECHC